MSSEIIPSRDRYAEYDTWAWLYNQTMGPEYCQNQLPPLEKMLLPLIPVNAKILDVCCGTGHIVQKLIERGYQVTGIDGSEQMLNYARQNAPQGEFLLADARTFQVSSVFDAVFSTSASLNHILSIPELKQVFQQVYAALVDNGIFFFDINHHKQMESWWKGEIVEGDIKSKYAWTLIPQYNPSQRTGYFQITLFQGQASASISWTRFFWSLLNPLFHQIQKISVFSGIVYKLRLKLLNTFQSQEKNWQPIDIKYFVRGHQPEEIKTLLEEVGFVDIDIRTLEGYITIDNNHSAYFICRKPKIQYPDCSQKS